MRESTVAHRLDEGDERVVVAGDVQEAAGLLVDAELRPGPLLGDLFERSRASGQRQERIGSFCHLQFALVHRLDDDELCDGVVDDFALLKRSRNDAGHRAARLHRRVGDGAHQADVASAIDHSDAMRGEGRSDGACRLQVDGVAASARPAEHRDRERACERILLAAGHAQTSTSERS